MAGPHSPPSAAEMSRQGLATLNPDVPGGRLRHQGHTPGGTVTLAGRGLLSERPRDTSGPWLPRPPARRQCFRKHQLPEACPFLMSNSPLAPKSGSLRPNVRPTNGWKHSDEEQVPGLATCLERPAPNRRLLGFGGLWVTEALSTVDPPTPGLSASQGDRWRVTPDSGQVLWPADKGPRGVPSAADGCLHPAAQGLGPAAATRCSGRWHLLLQLLRVAAPAQLRHPRAFTHRGHPLNQQPGPNAKRHPLHAVWPPSSPQTSRQAARVRARLAPPRPGVTAASAGDGLGAPRLPPHVSEWRSGVPGQERLRRGPQRDTALRALVLLLQKPPPRERPAGRLRLFPAPPRASAPSRSPMVEAQPLQAKGKGAVGVRLQPPWPGRGRTVSCLKNQTPRETYTTGVFI